MTGWIVRRSVVHRDAGDHTSDETGIDPQEFVIDESLGFLVNRAARLMAQQLADELRPAGVAIGQWAVRSSCGPRTV